LSHTAKGKFTVKVKGEPVPTMAVIKPETLFAGKTATISISVKNSGRATDKAYTSISFMDDIKVVEYSVGGKLYGRGEKINHKNESTPRASDYELVEWCEKIDSAAERTYFVKIKVDPAKWLILRPASQQRFMARLAFLQGTGGNYVRYPAEGPYTDQQGWPAEAYWINVVYTDDMAQIAESRARVYDGYKMQAMTLWGEGSSQGPDTWLIDHLRDQLIKLGEAIGEPVQSAGFALAGALFEGLDYAQALQKMFDKFRNSVGASQKAEIRSRAYAVYDDLAGISKACADEAAAWRSGDFDKVRSCIGSEATLMDQLDSSMSSFDNWWATQFTIFAEIKTGFQKFRAKVSDHLEKDRAFISSLDTVISSYR
jgi:hypothetical protein